jgi:16S rRNA C967 or C1407 C5-methylase (RsmB/RsmF family)
LLLEQENSEQMAWLAAQFPGFQPLDLGEIAGRVGVCLPEEGRIAENMLQLNPYQHGTDGFFVGVWQA